MCMYLMADKVNIPRDDRLLLMPLLLCMLETCATVSAGFILYENIHYTNILTEITGIYIQHNTPPPLLDTPHWLCVSGGELINFEFIFISGFFLHVIVSNTRCEWRWWWWLLIPSIFHRFFHIRVAAFIRRSTDGERQQSLIECGQTGRIIPKR